MNKMLKKCVALVAAMSMVMAPCTVFASGTTPITDPDKAEIGGEAGVEYYPNKVKVVTLPTNTMLSNPFTIDPQGALSITADDGAVVTGSEGAIVPQSIVSIKNASSYAVNVKADLYLTKDLDTGDASSVTLVTASTNLANSTNNEIYLNAYCTADITDADLTTLNAANKDYQLITNSKFTTPINITANGKANAMELSFKLKEATYKLTQESGTKGWHLDSSVSDNYSQVAFCIGGNVAQKADWSKYGTGDGKEKIAVKAIFTFEDCATPTNKVEVTSASATAPGFLSNTTVYGSTVAAGTKEATVETNYVIDNDTETDLTLPIDFGKGGKKVTVTSVNITQGSDNVQLVKGVDYDVTSTGITLKDSSDALWCFEWPETSTVWVGCADADGVETWLSITFTTAEN